MKCPVFVFGYARSGTTVLRAILSQHSSMEIVHEPEILPAVYGAGYTVHTTFGRKERERVLEEMRCSNPPRRYLERLPEGVLQGLLGSREELSFGELYERLVHLRPDASVWGDKSLSNVYYLDELFQVYPDALAIHIYRDPRSAAISNYVKQAVRESGTSRRTIGGRLGPFQRTGGFLRRRA